MAAIGQATICLINKERTARALPPLAENAKLDDVAAQHSSDMVVAGYFNHVSPSGRTPAERVLASGYVRSGLRYRLGENLAIGTTGVDSPSRIVAAWMNEPGHEAVILNPTYRETGVGVTAQVPARTLSNDGPGATYTQEFGMVGRG